MANYMSIENYKRIWGSKSPFANKNKPSRPRKETFYEMQKRLAAAR